jgi:hypothetical protein
LKPDTEVEPVVSENFICTGKALDTGWLLLRVIDPSPNDNHPSSDRPFSK